MDAARAVSMSPQPPTAAEAAEVDDEATKEVVVEEGEVEEVSEAVEEEEKKVKEVVDDEIIIHLNLKGSPYLHAGVGLLNISYWESRVSNGLEAQVVFDVNTGKWLREQVISDKNNQVWNTVCSDWISGNPELPGKITIEMPQGQVGARLYPLTFRAFFDRQGKQWHLTKATMHEQITDESGSTSQQLRALAELKLTVTKEKQKPDHSGQGSKGKSPKE